MSALRWHSDYTLCNNPRCTDSATCWRYQALKRLGEDQGKEVLLPRRISVASFGAANGDANKEVCQDFELDEYEEEK